MPTSNSVSPCLLLSFAFDEKHYKGKCQVVKFSRHAKRRAKLYTIPESTVEKILADSDLSDGDHEVIRNVPGFKYPIKIVVSVESNAMTVITNYPLKKGRSQ